VLLRGLVPGFNNLPANLRGMIFMLASTVLFAAAHGIIRHLSTDIHPFEIAFFRNMFGFILLAPLILRSHGGLLQTRRLPLHMLRALLNAAAMLLFYMALAMAPLAEVTALGFAAPVFATVLAIPMLGEKVGIRRWLAILAGFAGAMIILRPGFQAVSGGAMAAFVSAGIWAFVLIIIKRLGRTESALTISAYMVTLVMPLSLIPALFVWTWPSPADIPWLIAIGVLCTIAQTLVAYALKSGDAQVVMPMEFFRLIWIATIGYIVFVEVPTVFTWIGSTIIVASASYIAYRESRNSSAACQQ
jgi:drug/metabolite transporter (DMT)-like permease